MIYAFDLDGTLITSYMDNPDRDYHTWWFLPGRAERIAELRRAGARIAIVTNQGGVAFGLIQQSDVEYKLTTIADLLGYGGLVLWPGGDPEEFETLVDSGVYLNAFVCYADARSPNPFYRLGTERRKPSGTMLRELAEQFAEEIAVYVGDRSEDAAAADAAGVPFVWADDFFGPANTTD